MLKIRKGTVTKEVTKASYNNFFKRVGYSIVESEKKHDAVKRETTKEQQSEVKIYDGVPITEMTKKQLIEFCKDNNIDIRGTKNINEARKIVQETIKQNKM